MTAVSGERTEPPGDERLDGPLEEYERLLDEGGAPEPEEFAARFPEDLREAVQARCRDVLLLRRHLPGPSSSHDLEAPKELGEFRLLRRLGRGGMGVVYLARQASLDREVAVKVLLPHLTQTQRQIDRFRREAVAVAGLQHPGIVPIHTFDRVGDAFYFTMEFVPGHGLDVEIRAQREARTGKPDEPCILPSIESRDYIPAVAALCAEIGEALDHGHHAGVVHRDVKPANVLLDPDGHAHLVDFGLAKSEGDVTLSRPGELAGTIPYMSPEQALGKRASMDHRTDVFSLGVVLYELLTLRRPFDAEATSDLVMQIGFREPRPLRKLDPRIPRDLAIVCGQAMAKSAESRYESAGELAQDLRRFLGHEAIRARPPSTVQRVRNFARAHRTAVIAAVLATVALVVGFTWGRADAPDLEAAREGWLEEMEASGMVSPTRLSVLGVNGAAVSLRLVDAPTETIGAKLALGPAPVESYVLDHPGLYRTVVENELGFAEVTRYLAAGADAVLSPTIRETDGVVSRGMVRFPAGPFAPGRKEAPELSFELGAFWIDECEVSNREYYDFVVDTAHEWPAYWDDTTYEEAWGELPIVGVTWLDAVAYAEWAGKRLPTWSEWQRAGMGPEARLYPWGQNALLGEPIGNLDRGSDTGGQSGNPSAYFDYVRPVRSHPEARTPEGLFHLMGNVWEFTESVRWEDREGKMYVHYQEMVILGGGWGQSRENWDLNDHSWLAVYAHLNDTGFRCAKSERP